MDKIWVCLACGKRSNDQYGNNPINMGWDASCVLNSIEIDPDLLVIKDDRVVEILEHREDFEEDLNG